MNHPLFKNKNIFEKIIDHFDVSEKIIAAHWDQRVREEIVLGIINDPDRNPIRRVTLLYSELRNYYHRDRDIFISEDKIEAQMGVSFFDIIYQNPFLITYESGDVLREICKRWFEVNQTQFHKFTDTALNSSDFKKYFKCLVYGYGDIGKKDSSYVLSLKNFRELKSFLPVDTIARRVKEAYDINEVDEAYIDHTGTIKEDTKENYASVAKQFIWFTKYEDKYPEVIPAPR